jgi:hypothetical protein
MGAVDTISPSFVFLSLAWRVAPSQKGDAPFALARLPVVSANVLVGEFRSDDRRAVACEIDWR